MAINAYGENSGSRPFILMVGDGGLIDESLPAVHAGGQDRLASVGLVEANFQPTPEEQQALLEIGARVRKIGAPATKDAYLH